MKHLEDKTQRQKTIWWAYFLSIFAMLTGFIGVLLVIEQATPIWGTNTTMIDPLYDVGSPVIAISFFLSGATLIQSIIAFGKITKGEKVGFLFGISYIILTVTAMFMSASYVTIAAAGIPLLIFSVQFITSVVKVGDIKKANKEGIEIK